MSSILYVNEQDEIADIGALLTILQCLDERNHTDLALDTLFDEFDTQLLAENFDYCEKLLLHATPRIEMFSPTLNIGFLTISIPMREEFPARAEYYQRVAEHFATLFDAERCTRLLQGLG